jgi:hypothetical protein
MFGIADCFHSRSAQQKHAAEVARYPFDLTKKQMDGVQDLDLRALGCVA